MAENMASTTLEAIGMTHAYKLHFTLDYIFEMPTLHFFNAVMRHYILYARTWFAICIGLERKRTALKWTRYVHNTYTHTQKCYIKKTLPKAPNLNLDTSVVLLLM